MPRKKDGSLRYQVIDRLIKLQQFGYSKHQAKEEYRTKCEACGQKWNPAFASGIYSHNTFNSYKQTAMEFVSWLKNSQIEVKNIDNITKEHAVKYLKSREEEGKSAWTVSKDMSALNKTFSFNITKEEANLKERSYHDVTRSRIERKNDSQYNAEKYQKEIIFARAFGCRRQSVFGGQYQVKECSLFKDSNSDKVFAELIEKGGKYRVAPCLKANQEEIEKMFPIQERNYIPPRNNQELQEAKVSFQQRYEEASEDSYLFTKYPHQIDNHSFRSEYAAARYEELLQEKLEQGETVKEDYRNKYDSEILMEVSKNLGHNRLSVVFEYYLR